MERTHDIEYNKERRESKSYFSQTGVWFGFVETHHTLLVFPRRERLSNHPATMSDIVAVQEAALQYAAPEDAAIALEEGAMGAFSYARITWMDSESHEHQEEEPAW